ncbi:putative proteasome subunit beta type-3 [Zancudomyces culisetae]|uniref:Putative proteasome subunit beta type-3 n=1 Tax=Zancudomyces culisetae TaxID=1213189 RepID=A0A1R1PH50_ZANCU|nr:putative proteasome subunit beta type-3 [Zancudomyces culisetae]|eukprot:OMH80301.1 putative proteasome subunit beta type-3 [Zancudomyces culisetae]
MNTVNIFTRYERFRYKANMYRMNEQRELEPEALSNMVSSTLYKKSALAHKSRNYNRFGPYYIEPIIAGLDKHNNPYICGMDLIGCLDVAKDFIVAGSADENLKGMCEGLWEPDLEPEELFETISQALLNAVDRDALSGWGAVVHVMFSKSFQLLTFDFFVPRTPDRVITRDLKARMVSAFIYYEDQLPVFLSTIIVSLI